MPISRDGKRADAQSKETTYSGLPKACKLKLAQNEALTGGAWNPLVFDTVVFNYGGFVFPLAGAFMRGIIIPEPGIYRVEVQMVGNQTAAYTYLQLNLSTDSGGVAAVGLAGPDGTGPLNIGISVAASNDFTCARFETLVEYRQGHEVGAQVLVSGTTTTSLANNQFITISKEGGQY